MNREKIKVDRDREKIKVKKKMIDYPRYNRKSRKKIYIYCEDYHNKFGYRS